MSGKFVLRMKYRYICVDMTRITKGVIANTFVAICIAMQIMVILPHHHHEGSNVPCVNMFHCMGNCPATTQPDCACGDNHTAPGSQEESHSHDATDSDCSLNHMDAIRLDRERVSGLADLAVSMLAEVTIETLIPCKCTYYINLISELDRKRLRAANPIHTDYIALATPPRAPSATV